jgi:hypothetical protein
MFKNFRVITKLNVESKTAITLKLWQVFAGIVTIFLIGRYLRPVEQGYYYTFASLIAIQTFFELGLYLVISVNSSHEWAHLSLDSAGKIVGLADAKSRLVSLGRFMFKWYGVVACFYFLIAGSIGVYVLQINNYRREEWLLQWLVYLVFSVVLFWITPFLYILEGCGQFVSVTKFRILQSVGNHFALWLALSLNLGLWSLALGSLFAVVAVGYYLIISNKSFFLVFYSKPAGEIFDWQRDLFPMQWRLALQGVFTYLSFPIYPTLVFSLNGPEEAGKIGMTLQIVSAIQSFGAVQLSSQGPTLAILIAKSQKMLFETEWKKVSCNAIITVALLSALFLGSVIFANAIGWHFIGRILPANFCSMFLCGAVFNLAAQSIALYLRSQKVERMTSVGVISGLLYGCLAVWVAPKWGVYGLAASYLGVSAAVVLPMSIYIFYKAKREF